MENDINKLAADLKQRAAAMAEGSTFDPADSKSPIRDRVVKKMLKNGSELMNSCATLANGPHENAVNVLIRSLIEMGIKVHWATISEENAAYLDGTTKEQIKTITRVNTKTGILCVVDANGNDVTESVLSTGRAAKSRKTLSIETMACQCQLEDIYNIFYRFQSLHTHGNVIASESASTNPITLNCVGAFSMLLGHSGVRWLLHRSRPNNEEIRVLLGLNC